MTSGCQATDIKIIGGVFDTIKSVEIRMFNIPQIDGGVKISNTFFSAYNSSTEQFIYANNCYHIYTETLEMYANATSITSVYLVSCHNCNMSFNTNNGGYAFVDDSNCSNNNIHDCSCSTTVSQSGSFLINGTEQSFSGLPISGNFTTGVTINGNNNILIACPINISGTKYTNNGTGNQIAYIA